MFAMQRYQHVILLGDQKNLRNSGAQNSSLGLARKRSGLWENLFREKNETGLNQESKSVQPFH